MGRKKSPNPTCNTWVGLQNPLIYNQQPMGPHKILEANESDKVGGW